MSVNVEAIMQEIREEIKTKGYTYDMLSFKDVSTPLCSDNESDAVSVENAEKNLAYMDNTSHVAGYRPLDGNKLVVLIKRIIRKFTKFYVEPVVASQNEFNSAAVRTAGSLMELVKVQSNAGGNNIHINEMYDRISTIELQLKTAHSDIQALNQRIRVLEAENRELKNSESER